jgi:hypothetical protein
MIFQNFGYNQNYPVSGVAPVVGGIQPLAISSSLYAYYDIAFTASYSGSGQTTVFDLSGNNKSGSVVGTVNYNTAGISGSVLRLGASGNGNRVEMPALTLGVGQTWVMAWYMQSANYQFDFTEFFAGRDPDAYGMFAANNVYNACILPLINDQYGATLTPTPTNTGQSGSWHISQISFNDTTNTLNYCLDGGTGSYTLTTAVSTGNVTPKWNFNNVTGLPNRYLNSGSMMQVMALYTGSLSNDEMLQNYNGLKARYGL